MPGRCDWGSIPPPPRRRAEGGTVPPAVCLPDRRLWAHLQNRSGRRNGNAARATLMYGSEQQRQRLGHQPPRIKPGREVGEEMRLPYTEDSRGMR